MQRSSIFINNVVITNPKLYKESSSIQGTRVFPYYAGYSSAFAQNLLGTLRLDACSIVLDPWNGSGTTTCAALNLGHNAIGLDLNPVMVVVAKARLLSPLEHSGLVSIAKSLVEHTYDILDGYDNYSTDPLLTWFSPKSVSPIRALEHRINRTLISNEKYITLNNNEAMDQTSPLAAFFYVSLFRTVRRLLVDFIPSNPTWVKKPKTTFQRKRPSPKAVFDGFIAEVQSFISSDRCVDITLPESELNIALNIGDAEQIDLDDNTVDTIISSPPYCTRIDYAVSTAIELAVLRFEKSEFDILRRRLTGTSTVEPNVGDMAPNWGATCVAFLNRLYKHPSKASKSYYYKNHLQFFNSLHRSLQEASRVLKPGGYCFLVVQDSHYKEIHNDVPAITSEMASGFGLRLIRRADFSASRSMVGVNQKSKKYLQSRDTTESVLCFQSC